MEDSSYAEGVNIPGRQPLRSDDDSALAKSLPMRVPAMSNYRSQDIDIEDDRVTIHNLKDVLIHFDKVSISTHLVDSRQSGRNGSLYQSYSAERSWRLGFFLGLASSEVKHVTLTNQAKFAN